MEEGGNLLKVFMMVGEGKGHVLITSFCLI